MSKQPHILVVEDDRDISALVARYLRTNDCRVSLAVNGRELDRLFDDSQIDLIVLDLMLPGLDGVSVCRAIRRQGPNRDVPILMLTARHDESDKVVGLESGADDYLTKPFGVRELVARVAALLRRARGTVAVDGDTDAKPLTIRGLEIDPARRSVRVRGTAVEMTRQEFSLLYVLASQPGIVFTRERLLARVWQGQAYVTERSVDTLIKRLRRKVEEDPAEPRLLQTVWGDGYKFADA
jgi:DNA-binding response OmpR family regulator